MISNEEPERALLVDFDWGGTVNDRYYPTALMNEELRNLGPRMTFSSKEHSPSRWTS